ncbi:mitochondrial substrate carrier family protein B isoform X2 [Jatropha curcas]|uniref:mitochondrial substrate carrier family protein B isoform X2 n=1 Tax=Jatropha curcas TaxID=180498 RepID=UPI0009D6C29F|nr:mitochondrial substrate carrier family protein B isoform X2 [Jatropha curcas]
MQTEARVGVVVEGGPRALSSQQKQQKPFHKQQSQIGTFSQLMAGGVAGALSKTCTAPLARLTILFQMLYTIPGLESHRESVGGGLFVHFVGGGMAGITAASATYPLDLVRTRLAAQTNVIYYRGIAHALRTISRDEGVLGLYKGLGATLLGVGPNIAISFTVYETLRSFWQTHRPHDSTVAVSLACGSLSGIASSTATFPLDLVRRRKQLEGAGGRARVYTTGLFGTFKHIIQTEGFWGLYRGILPEYYKVVPGVGICFMTYETLKMLLADVTAKL